MKKFFEDIMNYETGLTLLIALLLGLFLGVFFQTQYSVGIRTVFHNIYTKLCPDTQKDSKTIIMERVTKDTPNLPQKDIFETPKKKENEMVLFIKRLFIKEKKTEQTINDVVLN